MRMRSPAAGGRDLFFPSTPGGARRFFDDVEVVKEDLRGLEALHRRLQAAHEEGKTAHDARAVKALRARTDADVDQVLPPRQGAGMRLARPGEAPAQITEIPSRVVFLSVADAPAGSILDLAAAVSHRCYFQPSRCVVDEDMPDDDSHNRKLAL
ncbi:hypothetical protein C2845_PMPSC055566 [Panicum miliaceum]|uniref:Syntaxin N-terminal domain-containing protein n=1 Tax=Panicum miliaceum TaxID=4540 RepID=A0A3L6P9N0_PANMI|nr:hypothetical protein C2845_PMPSC055566 [Panicum miliaceum]